MDRARLLQVIAKNEEYMGRAPSVEDLCDCVSYTKLIKAVITAMDEGGDVQAASDALASWQKVFRAKVVLAGMPCGLSS